MPKIFEISNNWKNTLVKCFKVAWLLFRSNSVKFIDHLMSLVMPVLSRLQGLPLRMALRRRLRDNIWRSLHQSSNIDSSVTLFPLNDAEKSRHPEWMGMIQGWMFFWNRLCITFKMIRFVNQIKGRPCKY